MPGRVFQRGDIYQDLRKAPSFRAGISGDLLRSNNIIQHFVASPGCAWVQLLCWSVLLKYFAGCQT